MLLVHAAPVRCRASPRHLTGQRDPPVPPPVRTLRPRIGHAGGVADLRRLLDRVRARRPGLRTQVTVFFMLTGLVVSVILSIITYLVARNYLVSQRERAVRNQALTNATLVQTRVRDLRDRGVSPAGAIDSVTTERDGFALLVLTLPNGTVIRRSTRSPLETALPPALLDAVETGSVAGTQRFVLRSSSARFGELDGQPYFSVGVPLQAVNAAYYEAFPMGSSQNILRVIGTALVLASAVTAGAGAALGFASSRRLMRPLVRVADVAGELATGALDVRLESEADPDLDRLAESFNAMADAVQARIEREARFASDVSHELRSPITALSAAIDVLDARRDEFQGRSGQALDVVVTQVRRFDQMVLDLLELSRLDAGATETNLEPLVLEDTVRRIAQRYGYSDVPIEVERSIRQPVNTDKRRLERILANLLDNARHHGGGAVRISLEGDQRHGVRIAVEDDGPGVDDEEKQRIFERFARGTQARHRVGTGLGLALVAEHAHALGGRAWVEDRPGGRGARFVVFLPKGAKR